jgi:hypothetical protein
MNRILTVIAFLAVAFAAPASAQTAFPACDGDWAAVRVSTIKPTSSLAAFMRAQEAHIAWYRKNGFTNNQIYTARVLVTGGTTSAMTYSETEVMSFHVRPPAPAAGASVSSKDQAGWDAYVKLYRDTSDLKSEHFACLPKNR